jgi:hypothetical protein
MKRRFDAFGEIEKAHTPALSAFAPPSAPAAQALSARPSSSFTQTGSGYGSDSGSASASPIRSAERQKLPSYTPRSDAISELSNLDMPGESRRSSSSTQKPIRTLRNLVAYDAGAKSGNMMVPFDVFEKKKERRRDLVMEGVISPTPATDEDLDFADEEVEGVGICMCLRDMEDVGMDIEFFNGCVFLDVRFEILTHSQCTTTRPLRMQTPHATYIILSVDKKSQYYVAFLEYYVPRRSTQVLLAIIKNARSIDLATCRKQFQSVKDEFIGQNMAWAFLQHDVVVSGDDHTLPLTNVQLTDRPTTPFSASVPESCHSACGRITV